MQEYLNATEQLWSLVTNGERLRLLRDSSRTVRPVYVEFDLRAMLEGETFSEFALLYRLLHRTRFPQGADDAPRCLLERYHIRAEIDARIARLYGLTRDELCYTSTRPTCTGRSSRGRRFGC